MTQMRSEHLVSVSRRDMEALIAWLRRPSGAHVVGRVTFESVEDGGVLIRTRPYVYDGVVTRGAS